MAVGPRNGVASKVMDRKIKAKPNDQLEGSGEENSEEGDDVAE